ncbi:MAG: hypothetical protein M3008_00425 [Chloroflexota bacterium]|nr:hypothetical protein [Chloroflexota bacterium]
MFSTFSIAAVIAGVVFACCLTLGYARSPLRSVLPQAFLVIAGFSTGLFIIIAVRHLQHAYPMRWTMVGDVAWGALVGTLIGYFAGLPPRNLGRAQNPNLPPRDPECQFEDDLRAFLHPITPIVGFCLAGGVLIGLLAALFRL